MNIILQSFLPQVIQAVEAVNTADSSPSVSVITLLTSIDNLETLTSNIKRQTLKPKSLHILTIGLSSQDVELIELELEDYQYALYNIQETEYSQTYKEILNGVSNQYIAVFKEGCEYYDDYLKTAIGTLLLTNADYAFKDCYVLKDAKTSTLGFSRLKNANHPILTEINTMATVVFNSDIVPSIVDSIFKVPKDRFEGRFQVWLNRSTFKGVRLDPFNFIDTQTAGMKALDAPLFLDEVILEFSQVENS